MVISVMYTVRFKKMGRKFVLTVLMVEGIFMFGRRTFREKERQLRRYARLRRITKTEFKELIRLSRDRNLLIRLQVAEILIDVMNQASKKLLVRLAKDRDELVRTEAYDSLHVFWLSDVEEFLRKAIKREKDELACTYAIRSWGIVASKIFDDYEDDITFTNELLKTKKIKESERCRLECFDSLYRFGDETALAEIVKFAESDDCYTRQWVYRSLEEFWDQENKAMVIDTVEKLIIKEEYPAIRKEFLTYLKMLITEEELDEDE